MTEPVTADVVADRADEHVRSPDGREDLASTPPDGAESPAAEALGRCTYTNVFSAAPECKEYTGASWTRAAAEADCAAPLGGKDPSFEAGQACGFDAELGRCVAGDVDTGFVLVMSGADPEGCGLAEMGCTTFLSGAFEPSGLCVSGAGAPGTAGGGGVAVEPGDVPPGVFIPPYLSCQDPLEGEPDGASADGQVCTPVAISGCTEPGREFADYGSCEVVRTQRPYWAATSDVQVDPQDPRLSDEAWLAEVAWVRDEISACACTCCHSDEHAPDGASGWDIDAGPLWVDTIGDEGVAMLAGWVDSYAFGAYEAAHNNGFSRDETGLPTTDPARMQAFFVGEYQRRGFGADDADEIPAFGGPMVTQLEYQPEPCPVNVGMDAEGRLRWVGADARYVYVLEEGAANPGVPPNLDLPAGTLWRLDVPPTQAPLESGAARYGEVPAGAVQRWPEAGDAPVLEAGGRYYLYVLYDVAIPLARCLFDVPAG